MKAVSHTAVSSQTGRTRTRMTAGKPGPELLPGNRKRLKCPRGTFRFGAALEALGRREVGITTLLLLADS